MLKSLLQLLLSKFINRVDTEFVSTQAMPEGWSRRIVLKDLVLGDYQGVYYAPCDGYFCIDGGNRLSEISINGSVHSRLASTLPEGTHWPQIFIPARKGATINYKVSVASGQTEGSTAYFVPAVGVTTI
jgi:hypothetical protein